jgi:hypothetical protein
MIEKTKKYLIPDQRWNIWGIKSRDDFDEKVVTYGKFIEKVPEKIINDYSVVERLLWYSYYYYPLFDEALSKATRIFESAISQRIYDLELDKQNKIKNLSQKIKKLKPFVTDEVYLEWEKAREVRNLFAHPIPGSLFGMVFGAPLQMVNIINCIFLEKKVFEKNEQKLNELQDTSANLRDTLMTFKYNDRKILIWSILPHYCFETENILKSFWIFHPVLISFPQTMEELSFTPPIGMRLKEIKIHENGLKAIDLESDQEIELVITNNARDIELRDRYKTLLESAEKQVKDFYFNYLDSEMSLGIIKFKYEEWW